MVEELSSFQDEAGYICDDNMTLGLMADGAAPRLAPGFWAPCKQEMPPCSPVDNS